MRIVNGPQKYKILYSLLVLAINFSNFYLCGYGFADSNDLNFKVYNPDQNSTADTTSPAQNPEPAPPGGTINQGLTEEKPVNDSNLLIEPTKASAGNESETDKPKVIDGEATDNKSNTSDDKSITAEYGEAKNSDGDSKTKVLQGYVRVVPSGTKMSIIMDTAVDSDTSQEGDEFSARTAEDLTIDGTTAVPAGSIIRGRIATLNAPKHLNRSGSVALKFDSVTTPDNRQIPLVANLVARGGVVHARRGIKDIAIDTGTFALPTVVALGIGAVAGHSSSSVGIGGGALIGAGVGAVIGVAILMAKKGKRVDVRPGDELKIELAEDLHMPTM